jgi:hypothetical protein
METRNRRPQQDAEPEMPLTERQPAQPTGMEEMLQKLLQQLTSQGQQMTSQGQQLTSQGQLAQQAEERMVQQMASHALQTEAALKTSQEQLQMRVTTTLAEHAENLERRLVGQLSQETEKIREVFRKEVSAVCERVDAVERGQEIQQQHLASQQQKLDRLDAVVGRQEIQHKEVGVQLHALTGQVDAVQRELYQRLSTIEGGRAAESLNGRGLSRPETPSVEGGSVKIKTRPAPFDGRTSWVGYKAQFDLIADLNGWTLTDRAQYLAASLAGPALTILTNLGVSERLSYEHLTEALNTRFNEGRSAELARVRLDNRKQLSNEKLALYASEVENLTQLAYPTAGAEARDVLTRERFLKGLLSSELRKQIKLARAATFPAMLGVAIELEAVLLGEADSADHLIARRSAVRLIQEDGSSPRKRVRGACFRCGSLSHQLAFCDADPADCERLPSRTSGLIANSRRNFQPANVSARVRRASDSRGEFVHLENDESSEKTQNLSSDILGAIERLGRRVDVLAADRRQRDVAGGSALAANGRSFEASGGRGGAAAVVERPQRGVTGNARRSGSLPRGGSTRRGECFECGSAEHYRNSCPLLRNSQPLN